MLCEIGDCENEAEYDAPWKCCRYHWAAWWVDGEMADVKMTPEQRETAIQLLANAGESEHDLNPYLNYTFGLIGMVMMGPPDRNDDWNMEPIE